MIASAHRITSTVPCRWRSNMVGPSHDGQRDRDGGSLIHFAPDVERAAVQPDHLFHQRQSQVRSRAARGRAESALRKNFSEILRQLLGRDADARVLDDDRQLAVVATATRKRHSPASRRVLGGVAQHVDQRGGDLVLVEMRFRPFLRQDAVCNSSRFWSISGLTLSTTSATSRPDVRLLPGRRQGPRPPCC